MVRSVLVYWRTGSGQERVTQSNDYNRTRWDIETNLGGSIYKVTTVGGGEQYRTPQGHYTTKDKVLYEAEKEEPSVESKPLTKREKDVLLIAETIDRLPISVKQKREALIRLYGAQPDKEKVRTSYVGKGKDSVYFPDSRPDFEKRPVGKDKVRVPAYSDLEKEMGGVTGLTRSVRERYPKDIQAVRVREYKKVERGGEELERLMVGTPEERVRGLGLWVTSGFMLGTEDPLGALSASLALTGDWDKAIELKTRSILGISESVRRYGPFFTAAGGPLVTSVAMTYGMSALFGAGLGALRVSFPTLYKAAMSSLLTYGTYETVKPLAEGDYKSFYSNLTNTAIMLPVAIAGYGKGYTLGYGKTEAYLYKIHTFKPGSAEWIRFEEALKVSSLLKDVPGIKQRPVDFAKEILRMDVGAANKLMGYIRMHPGKVVIGGSAAARGQIAGARLGRDVDLYILGNKEFVAATKSYFKKEIASGVLDIHGSDMFAPGKVHKFWFTQQKPIKIEGIKYVRPGELTGRKGISSVLVETRYRHGIFPGFPRKGTMQVPKDIADFVVAARSQVKSGLGKLLYKSKALSAEKHLELYLKPWKSPSYGKSSLGLTARVLKAITKAPTPLKLVSASGKSYYGFYPKYPKIYPLSSYLVNFSVKSYPLYKSFTKRGDKPFYIPPYKPPKTPPYKPPKIPPIKPPYAPPRKPPKTPPYKPPKIPPIKPPYAPPRKPPKTPPYKPPYIPPVIPPFKPPPPYLDSSADFVVRARRSKMPVVKSGLSYREREFKMPKMESMLTGFKNSMKVGSKSKKKKKKRGWLDI